MAQVPGHWEALRGQEFGGFQLKSALLVDLVALQADLLGDAPFLVVWVCILFIGNIQAGRTVFSKRYNFY